MLRALTADKLFTVKFLHTTFFDGQKPCKNMIKKQLVAKMMLVMKLTLQQIVLTLLLFNQIYATSSNAQILLNKPIKIDVKEVELRSVLAQLQTQTNVKFIFSSKAINTSRKVSCKLLNSTLADFLNIVLKPLDIGFKVIDDDRLLLFNSKNSVNVGNLEPNSMIENINENKSLDKIVVTGIIKDSAGRPLEGVTIKVKKTTIKTVSDKDGHFSIRVEDKNAVLVFSYVGYETLEQTVASSSMDIAMIQIPKKLDEIVVIGYDRAIRKKDLTIAAGKVEMSELQKAPVVSFEGALAGRVAGVTVVSPDGQPGAVSTIVIRGNNSVTQDNSPLYVIDGFPIENPDNNMLNPAEIESMEILKDASATAIYGARGANGVILITTKKGKVGTPMIEFQAYRSTQKIAKRIPLMTPYEYVQYQYELNPSGTLQTFLKSAANNPSSIDSVMNQYKQVKGVDLQNDLFGTPAPFINGYLAIRGGNDKTKYNISGNYADQEGIIVNSGFKRYQLKINFDQTLNSKIKIGTNTTFTYTNQYGISPTGSGISAQAAPTSYLMASVWGHPPILNSGNFDSLVMNLNDPNFDFLTATGIQNPLTNSKNEYHRNDNYNLVSNLYLDYQLISGLKLRVSAGVNQTNNVRENFYNSLTSKGMISPINPNGVNGDFTNATNVNLTNENTVTYSKTFLGLHHLNILSGVTEQETKQFSKGGSATNIPNESLGIDGLDQGVPGVYSVSSSENTLVSFLGRVQYDYDTKYLLSVSYRADGSSKFSAENKWAYFPSFSAAWRLSKERFMDNISQFLDLKLRIGYGLTGNNRVNDYVTYSSLNNSYLPVNNTFTPYTSLASLGNPNLKWETTKQSNFGLDADLLQGKLELSIDYYNKETSDLILNASLPGSAGFSSIYENVGKIQNRGLEISLSTINISNKEFTWSTNFNISLNQNKVLALAENQVEQYANVSWNGNYNSTPLYIAKVGEPLGQMFGYLSDGVYQYADFDKSPTGVYTLKNNLPTSFASRSTLPVPGSVKLKDLNGDGVITNDDRTVIGRGNPIHFGGLNNNFKFLNFDISILLQWSYGNDIYNANRLIFENGSPNNPNSLLNMYQSYVNRWSPTNQTNDMPKANPGVSPGNYYWSRCVEDGSYLRVKTLSIGYNLSNKWMSKLNAIKSLRVYIATQNLFTWTKYSGFDPEVNGRPSALTPGFDYSVYPRAKTITFGANLTL